MKRIRRGMPARPAGRRERRKLATRRELLAAGRALFGERGLYDSRIEDLASVAGIAKGTLYGYFTDKEALIQAVVRDGFDALRDHVRAAAAGAKPGGARERAVLRAHLEFFAANPDLMRIFHQVRGLLKFRRPGSARLRAELARYLRVLAAALGDPPRDTGRAQLLFGAVSGVTSVHAALGRPLPAPAGRDAVVEGIVALLRVAAPRPAVRRGAPRRSGGSGGRRSRG